MKKKNIQILEYVGIPVLFEPNVIVLSDVIGLEFIYSQIYFKNLFLKVKIWIKFLIQS